MSHRKYGRWYVPFLLLLVFVLYSICYADVTPVADRTPQVRDAIVAAVPGVDSAADVTAEHLSTMTSLTLRLLKITSLASGDFSGLTGLTSLNLYGNQLSSLPAGIFEGLTSLTTLRLGRNAVAPLPLTVSLEKVVEGEFKAVVPAGATFDIVLPITVANGSITGGATEITISQGGTESSLFEVTRTPGTTSEVTVDIGTLPSLPRNHYGYGLVKSDALPLTIIDGINTDPVTDVQEVVHVETPNTAPTFAEGDSTTRAVAENVSAGTNIGAPISATDAEDDTLTWTLGGVDADSFEINSTTGQLKTKALLDYETKRVYSVSLTVADEELSDTITVIISVIDVSDTVITADVFPVVNRTPQVRDAIVAAIPTVRDATQVTATHLASITGLNLRNKGISALKIGDFSGLAALTNLNLSGNQLSGLPVGTFDGLGALTTLRLGGNVVDPLPLIVSLQQVRDSEYRAIIPTGAPFSIRIPITVTDGSISGGITSVVIPQGSRHSASFTVVGTSAKVSIGMLPGVPRNHYGYVLAQSTVSSRTEQVATAIAAAVGARAMSTVTETDLATITSLDLSGTSLTTLKTGDFADLVSLTTLNLSNNALTDLPAGIFDDTPSLSSITLANNQLSSLPVGLFTGLSSLGTVDLSGNSITSLSGDTFSGLSALTTLNLSNNRLSTLPAGIFEGLTSLNQLSLSGNTVDPLQIGVSLQKVGTNQFKAVAPTGAPFSIVLPLERINGTVRGGATTIQIPKGSVESQSLTMARMPNTIAAVEVDIVNVPQLLSNHNGYALVKSMTRRLEVLPTLNSPPVFTEGNSTTRTVAENTAAGTNIGTPVSATDADEDTLTYRLSGTDAAAFAIDTSSGQLQTNALLDYETKSSHTITLTVSDGKLTDTITVTINVTDVPEITVIEENEPEVTVIEENEPEESAQQQTEESAQQQTEESAQQQTETNNPPVFTDGTSTTRSVAENTASGQIIGSAVSATDADSGDTLTYTFGGTDANAFSIDSTNGQLRTSAALDYENKNSYSITVSVSDGKGGTDSINVTINVTDVVEQVIETVSEQETTTNTPPMFTDGASTTRSIAENTGSGVNIGSAVSATDADNDALTYTLGGTDANAFGINSTNGQLRTSAALDYENKNSYSITVSVSDGNGGTDSINVTINVTDVVEQVIETVSEQETTTNTPPVFTDGASTTRSIAENTGSGVNIGSAVSATDADNDALTYTFGGTDANAFSINSTNGQLRTSAALDYENKNSYSITVSVSDGNGGTDSITVTINVTDVNENRAPVFSEGTSTTRTVAENTESGVNIGTAVSATDADNDTLTYTLGSTDANAFSINSTNGQLRTSTALDYENKNSYSITVSVSDGNGGTDTITVTINITDVDETSNIIIEENEPEVSAQQQTEESAQQQTETNNPPVFTDGTSTTRSIAENTAPGQNIGSAVSATDADSGDTLTYTLGGTDASAFSINSTNGQLRTSAALDYENKNSYSITVSVSDGNGGTDSINVTINVTDVNENRSPVFTEGTNATRTVAENTGSGVDIGSAVSATDADNNALTYTLGGTDASAFSIDSTNGQLRTNAALDYENKNSYSITVSVSDGNGGTDSINVTINVTDVVEQVIETVSEQETTTNTPPVFTDGASTTRSIAENTGSGVNIGSAVSATDADNDALTYTLGGTDASAFSINSTNGQLRTNAALDYENKNSYSITVSVSDGNGGTDSITVTINVTDVDEKTSITLVPTVTLIVSKDSPTDSSNNAPVFTDGDSTTRTIAENTESGVNIGTAVSATDADNDTLTYALGGTDAASFSIVSSSGQLQTKASLDYERKASYSVIVSVSDGNSGSVSIDVTISVTDVNDNSAPVTVGSISTDILTVEEPSVQIDVSDNFKDFDGDTLTYTARSDNTSVATVSVSGSSVTITSVGTGNATITVTASDGQLTATQTISVSVDVDRPGVSISFNDVEQPFSSSYVTNGPFEMMITFTEPVSGFDVSDLEVDDDFTYSDFKAIDAETIEGTSFADTYTVTVIPDPNDNYMNIGVHIEAGVATDAAGNPNTHTNSPRITIEKHRPRVEISVPDADVTTTTFTIEIKFDRGNSREDRPLGFEQSDLSLTNNTAGATITKWTDKGGYGLFEVEITVTQSGQVTIGVAENVATDLAGNGNIAASQRTVTIALPGSAQPVTQDVDTTSPGVSISFNDVEQPFSSSYITNGPFEMMITFTEPVSGFDVSDLEVDDGYTYSDFKAVDAETIEGTSFADTYTVTVIPDPNDSYMNIGVHIEAGVATDAAGNPNTHTNSPRITIEKHRPRVEISVPDADVTTTTFTIEIKFDRGNSREDRPLGFEQSDLSLTNNTAGATITKWTDKGGYGLFEVEITVTQSGQVTIGVAENVATDLAGNGNTAATQKTVTIALPGSAQPVTQDADTTSPGVSISFNDVEQPFSSSYVTNGPFEMTITFTEPVSGFDVSDLEVDDDYTYSDFKAVDAETIEGTSFADTYTVTVIPDPNDNYMNIGVHIEAGVATDAAGNPNTHTNSPRITIEKHRPRVEISVPDADVTTTTFTIEIKFDRGNSREDRPLGFEQSDLSLTNNTAGATITKWTDKGGYGLFEVEITVTQSGQVTIGVAENVATDLAGNGNTAATQKTVTITLSNNQGAAPFTKWKIDETQLLANYPNPFNPETWIPYQLAKPSEVTITIFDVRGRVVRTLILGTQSAGIYRSRNKAAYWDGKNAFGEKVAGGLYFYMLTAGEFTATRKMLILK